MQINLLFLVAGYQHYDKLGGLDADGLKIHFDINAIGPLLMVQALRQNLQKGTKVLQYTSMVCCAVPLLLPCCLYCQQDDLYGRLS